MKAAEGAVFTKHVGYGIAGDSITITVTSSESDCINKCEYQN